MRVTAIVFGGMQGQPRYIPGVGNVIAVHVGQETHKGGKVASMDLDPLGMSVYVRLVDKHGKPVTEFGKTPQNRMLVGDLVGIPIGTGVLLYELEEHELAHFEADTKAPKAKMAARG